MGDPTARPSVAIGPVEVAGVSSTLAPALRRRGHRVTAALFEPHPFGYPVDRVVRGYARRLAFGLAAPLRHRVLHYQFGQTWFGYLDALWAALWRRPRLMHYHGDDCRLAAIALEEHPRRGRVVDRANDPGRERMLRAASLTCSAAICADLELLSYVRRYFDVVYLLPLAVELGPPPDFAPRREGPLRVVHAPSAPRIKGTDVIRAELEGLEGVELRLVSGVPHDEVLAAIRDADVVVDQLNSETYGVVAIEGMAAGKPVLCEYDRSKLASWCHDVPIVFCEPGTVAERVRELAADPAERERLGRAGRAFVERVNDPDRVAAATGHVYAHVATKPRPGVYEATPEGVTRVA
jgi:hypothetical protein